MPHRGRAHRRNTRNSVAMMPIGRVPPSAFERREIKIVAIASGISARLRIQNIRRHMHFMAGLDSELRWRGWTLSHPIAMNLLNLLQILAMSAGSASSSGAVEAIPSQFSAVEINTNIPELVPRRGSHIGVAWHPMHRALRV